MKHSELLGYSVVASVTVAREPGGEKWSFESLAMFCRFLSVLRTCGGLGGQHTRAEDNPWEARG